MTVHLYLFDIPGLPMADAWASRHTSTDLSRLGAHQRLPTRCGANHNCDPALTSNLAVPLDLLHVPRSADPFAPVLTAVILSTP